MPLTNRVDPFGAIFYSPDRGAFMGNRGGRIHNADKAIVRPWAGRAWITCALAFKGWKRKELMALNSYTELFFLDEATALSAGHRPCAECRRADYNRFKTAFVVAQAQNGATVVSAPDMDAIVHRERTAGQRRRAHAADLPDGVMVTRVGAAWLKRDATLHRWTPGGYTETAPLPAEAVEVLTPPSIVAAIGAGYAPRMAA